MISARNLIRHELIGLDVEVVESTNRIQVGIKGLVVD
jgi:ribonuclease P protein subunit POP4